MNTFAPLEYNVYRSDQPHEQTVLLLHGFASTASQVWVGTGWIKKILGERMNCIAVDLPYHGSDFQKAIAGQTSSSQEARVSHTSSVEVIGEELSSAIIEALHELVQSEASKVHVVGFSVGARLAWNFVLNYPNDVQTLTVAGFPQRSQFGELAEYLGSDDENSVPESLNPLFLKLIEQSPVTRRGLAEFVSNSAEADIDATTDFPRRPTLVVGSDADSVSGDSTWLLEGLQNSSVPSRHLNLENRNHINTLTSGIFKKAVLNWVKENSSTS